PADDMQGAAPVVVLGYDVWQRQFLQDPAIIGRVVMVGRTARTVVGVMPPRFGFPRNQQAWVPLPVQDAAPREGPAVQVFGRLADGASWRDAAAGLDVVSARSAPPAPAHTTPRRPLWRARTRHAPRACARGFWRARGARRAIRCGWKIWPSTPSSCCCWGRCRRT